MSLSEPFIGRISLGTHCLSKCSKQQMMSRRACDDTIPRPLPTSEYIECVRLVLTSASILKRSSVVSTLSLSESLSLAWDLNLSHRNLDLELLYNIENMQKSSTMNETLPKPSAFQRSFTKSAQMPRNNGFCLSLLSLRGKPLSASGRLTNSVSSRAFLRFSRLRDTRRTSKNPGTCDCEVVRIYPGCQL